MSITFKGIQPGSPAHVFREMLLAHAATADGFTTTKRGKLALSYAQQACYSLVKQGLLVRAKLGKEAHYFTTQQAADQYDRGIDDAFKARAASAKMSFAADVEIVYTKKTKYTVIPTPKARFESVDLPFGVRSLKGRVDPHSAPPLEPLRIDPVCRQLTR